MENEQGFGKMMLSCDALSTVDFGFWFESTCERVLVRECIHVKYPEYRARMV